MSATPAASEPVVYAPRVAFRSYGDTSVGRVRAENQDNYLISEQLGLFSVADGMGGHAGGETASRIAVEVLFREVAGALSKHRKLVDGKAPSLFGLHRDGLLTFSEVALTEPGPDGASMTGVTTRVKSDASLNASELGNLSIPPEYEPSEANDALLRAFARGNLEVFTTSQNNPQLSGMGTTMTAMVLARETAYFAHVGDSRVYLYREGEIRQLSDDHSLVNEHVKAGLITPHQAKLSFFRNIITRSVGTDRALLVDSFSLPVKAGDKFVLCSDGLINLVEDDEIAEVLAGTADNEVCEALVALANERGGDDNITVVFVCVEAAPGA